VSSPESITTFVEQLKEEHSQIDVLVHNAGLANDGSFPAPEDTSLAATQKRFELSSQVLTANVIGVDVLTQVLLPLLLKSKAPRLISITSGLGSIAMNLDPKSPFYQVPAYMYRTSKAAVNMIMTGWYKKLSGQGVKVLAVCPGFNITDLGGGSAEEKVKNGATLPEVGAGVIVDVILGKSDNEVGKVGGGDGKIRPW